MTTKQRVIRPPPGRIILGIDPGVATTGYAFLHEQRGKIRLLVCDVISTPKQLALPVRLKSLYEQLDSLLHIYNPTEAAVELLFFGRNRKTANAVGQARGVVLLALAQRDIPVAEYTPSAIKLMVTGSGRADKDQVGAQVQTLLRLPVIPRPDDAADAAATAICHVYTRRGGKSEI
jgi:crossover junction endodeoxyribonuclease RuvC